MDGQQGKLTKSLQYRLSFWLILLILGVAIAAGIFSLLSAFDEANDLQDNQLRQVATLIKHHQWAASPAESQGSIPGGSDPDALLVIQDLPASGPHTVKKDNPVLPLPTNLPNGMQTVKVGHQSWRIYVSPLDQGGRVAVGQLTELRDEIARDSALRTMMPFAVLIPLLLLLVGSLIQQMLKPLKNRSHELNHRSDQDMSPVDASDLPAEVIPFILAINRLLARVSQSMATQRRFVADAAHELRSPLTALSLQAERLEAAEMSDQARERLAILRNGLDRARSLLEQLLTLARVQQAEQSIADPCESVFLIFRIVLEDLMPLAEAKNIDIGVEGHADAMITTSRLDLMTLIKNLVENAIRYTPPGGRIDLSIEQENDSITIDIADTGPGIPQSEHQRIFDPFYRMLGSDETGSGLGLSIVKTIANRIGATISLSETRHHPKLPGVHIRVHIPRSKGGGIAQK